MYMSRKALSFALAAFTSLVLLRWLFSSSYLSSSPWSSYALPSPPPPLAQPDQGPPELPCRSLPGANDVLVVMKTGATETRLKLPVHFETTFKCTPHYVIFSSLDEEIDGHQIHDVLNDVSDEIKLSDSDFDLHRKLRAAKTAEELEKVEEETTWALAWNLDKWKFLPMVERAYKKVPEAKWFVFIEADTAMVWSHVLMWLANYDSSQPHFLGSQTNYTETVFAHGGSGFVLSNPAAARMIEYRKSHVAELEAITKQEWAGDLAFALAMKKAGMELEGAWPFIQSDQPATFDYGRSDLSLCNPVGTLHHMTAPEIREVWRLEQNWIAQKHTRPFYFLDLYDLLIRPKMADTLENWNNLSNGWEEPDAEGHESLEACQAACEKRTSCTQFLYRPSDRQCMGSASIQFGRLDGDSQSGWVLSRLQQWRHGLGSCPNPPEWTAPKGGPPAEPNPAR